MSDAELVLSVIDLLADDLKGAGILPAGTTTVLYRRPAAVFPEDCPLMVVWPLVEALALRTTEWYDGVLQLGVSYHEEAVQRATELVNDPDKAASLIRTTAAITDRLRRIGNDTSPLPSIGQVHGLYPANVNYLPGPEMEAGLVEGYLVTVQVDLVYKGE